jgi:hypothetical protein
MKNLQLALLLIHRLRTGYGTIRTGSVVRCSMRNLQLGGAVTGNRYSLIINSIDRFGLTGYSCDTDLRNKVSQQVQQIHFRGLGLIPFPRTNFFRPRDGYADPGGSCLLPETD